VLTVRKRVKSSLQEGDRRVCHVCGSKIRFGAESVTTYKGRIIHYECFRILIRTQRTEKEFLRRVRGIDVRR